MKESLTIACMLWVYAVSGKTTETMYLWFNGYRDGDGCPGYYISFEENIPSVTRCAKRCEIEPDCNGFYYSEPANICQGCEYLMGSNFVNLPTLQNSKYYFETPTWKQFDGSRYLLHKAEANCSQAQDLCVKHGGHLVNVGSSEEQDFLSNLTKQHAAYEAAYIGLNGLSGAWTWFDTKQTPTFTAWSPIYEGDIEGCVYIHDGSWRVSSYKQLRSFVCEK